MGTIVPATESDGRDLRRLMDQICADPAAFEQNVNENMRRNGERVWIAWTNRIVLDEQGQVAEILSIGTDITERKRAEEAIRELNASLERRVAERTAELAVAKDRAEAADRLKSAFLATMSHELRTPLNSIIGFTGILLQGLAGPLNAEQHKQLDMVRDSARHLLALINDVLDISKIEAGQLEMHSEPFDLRASIEKVVGDREAAGGEERPGPARGTRAGDRERWRAIRGASSRCCSTCSTTPSSSPNRARSRSRAESRRRLPRAAIRPAFLGRRHRHRHQAGGSRASCSSRSGRSTPA